MKIKYRVNNARRLKDYKYQDGFWDYVRKDLTNDLGARLARRIVKHMADTAKHMEDGQDSIEGEISINEGVKHVVINVM